MGKKFSLKVMLDLNLTSRFRIDDKTLFFYFSVFFPFRVPQVVHSIMYFLPVIVPFFSSALYGRLSCSCQCCLFRVVIYFFRNTTLFIFMKKVVVKDLLLTVIAAPFHLWISRFIPILSTLNISWDYAVILGFLKMLYQQLSQQLNQLQNYQLSSV